MKLLTTLRKCRWLMPPMTLLLVVSTSVPSLWRMYCPEMGKSRMAWGAIESCCHPDGTSDRAELRMHCCEYSVAHADLSTLDRSKGTRLAIPAFVIEAWALPQIATEHTSGMGEAPLRVERPPPRTGAERAALLRVMRV